MDSLPLKNLIIGRKTSEIFQFGYNNQEKHTFNYIIEWKNINFKLGKNKKKTWVNSKHFEGGFYHLGSWGWEPGYLELVELQARVRGRAAQGRLPRDLLAGQLTGTTMSWHFSRHFSLEAESPDDIKCELFIVLLIKVL